MIKFLTIIGHKIWMLFTIAFYFFAIYFWEYTWVILKFIGLGLSFLIIVILPKLLIVIIGLAVLKTLFRWLRA